MPIPDLLCATPALRLDAASLKQTLTFAFASGTPSSAFAQVLANTLLPASSWEPSAFAEQLFLSDFVASCLRVKINGRPLAVDQAHLRRVLSRPPSDFAVIEFRRGILAELAGSSEMRGQFEKAYLQLYELRTLLENPPLTRRVDANRRRLDILGAGKRAIDAMADSFAGARSGLSRLREFGEQTRAETGYARLASLLDYDEQLSTLDLRIRVGLDGRVRSLEMLGLRENTGNWFYSSPFGRFWARLSFLFRGYRLSEQELIARLIDGVFDGIEDEMVLFFQLMGDMEFYLAALALRDQAEAGGLAVCLPELVRPEHAGHRAPHRTIRELYNPLLLSNTPKVVTCEIDTVHHAMIVIVTGPNSGGKTRLLQALALTQMLGQSGCFVPAREARLLMVPGLFVSFIEEAKADQIEGRLGMELIRIRSVFEKLKMGSMVMLDELCSGTNPSEGEEIFELVVGLLAELEPQAFITTHFLRLASRIAEHPPTERLSFLQVELDEQQWPTYRFVPGVAATSLAHRTAARLGVTREELMALVERSKRAAALPAQSAPPPSAPSARSDATAVPVSGASTGPAASAPVAASTANDGWAAQAAGGVVPRATGAELGSRRPR
jgi:DNA mismatch repair protein MutS2